MRGWWNLREVESVGKLRDAARLLARSMRYATAGSHVNVRRQRGARVWLPGFVGQERVPSTGNGGNFYLIRPYPARPTSSSATGSGERTVSAHVGWHTCQGRGYRPWTRAGLSGAGHERRPTKSWRCRWPQERLPRPRLVSPQDAVGDQPPLPGASADPGTADRPLGTCPIRRKRSDSTCVCPHQQGESTPAF